MKFFVVIPGCIDQTLAAKDMYTYEAFHFIFFQFKSNVPVKMTDLLYM